MDLTFPHLYECRLLSETSTVDLPHYYYPGASTVGGRDGILVEVKPEHERPWMGTFAFGQISPKGFSAVFATPDSERLCVVAKGEGYIVSADDPRQWEMVRANPIIDVRPIPACGIIVFANFTEMVAYGQEGIRWRTKRLAWDDLKITEVSDTFIKGEFWDIRSEAMASFVVDLATGSHKGGIGEF